MDDGIEVLQPPTQLLTMLKADCTISIAEFLENKNVITLTATPHSTHKK